LCALTIFTTLGMNVMPTPYNLDVLQQQHGGSENLRCGSQTTAA